MCETMQSSHRLRPAMALVRALLAPTASGDGAGERFCAPLPPSPHFVAACPEKTREFPKNPVFFPLFYGGGPSVKSKWHVRVSKQSFKQANRLILWGVGSPEHQDILFFNFISQKN